MNKIQGILDNSDYEGYENFINFRIDDYWLDEKLEELYPGNMYKGLVPTLVFGMERDDEKDVVWRRILPDKNETTICPILMCPDDNDFSCILIVAEIRNCGQIIQWKRIGIDETKEWDAEKVGSRVQWLEKVTGFDLLKEDYEVMIETFEQQFLLDELRQARQMRT